MNSKGYKLNSNGIPAFEDLPLRKGDPHHSAWGLYGEDDELGTLNRLTDERVVEAAKAELKTGYRFVSHCRSCFQAKMQAEYHSIGPSTPKAVRRHSSNVKPFTMSSSRNRLELSTMMFGHSTHRSRRNGMDFVILGIRKRNCSTEVPL